MDVDLLCIAVGWAFSVAIARTNTNQSSASLQMFVASKFQKNEVTRR